MININLPDLPDGYVKMMVLEVDNAGEQGLMFAKSEHNYTTWYWNSSGYHIGHYFNKDLDNAYENAFEDFKERVEMELSRYE